MKLLLIGYGYLGQAVTRVFRENSWEVTAVSLSGGEGTIACDVSDPDQVGRLPTADFIVHCAASGRGGAEAYQRVYVDGCRNLTSSFPGLPLLFTSSTSVYAQIDGSVVTEDSPAVPDRETGQLLLVAEGAT
jgi:nucleoside-diphosphate-sugar epimerase